MLTITVGIQKGGVGKTTTAANLAHHFAREGLHVLLIDLDSQGQAGTFLGLDRSSHHRRAAELLRNHSRNHPHREHIPTLDTIHKDLRPGLDIIGGDARLAPAENDIRADPNAGRILTKRLADLIGTYDLTILDVGPGVTLLSELAYVAADVILTPVQPGEAASEGVNELRKRLAFLQDGYDLPRQPHYLFGTMMDPRELLSRDLDDFLTQYGDARGPNIRKNVKLAEATKAGQSIFEYAPRSSGAEDYARLGEWLRAQLRSLL